MFVFPYLLLSVALGLFIHPLVFFAMVGGPFLLR
jgi:hypothetical protein